MTYTYSLRLAEGSCLSYLYSDWSVETFPSYVFRARSFAKWREHFLLFRHLSLTPLSFSFYLRPSYKGLRCVTYMHFLIRVDRVHRWFLDRIDLRRIDERRWRKKVVRVKLLYRAANGITARVVTMRFSVHEKERKPS